MNFGYRFSGYYSNFYSENLICKVLYPIVLADYTKVDIIELILYLYDLCVIYDDLSNDRFEREKVKLVLINTANMFYNQAKAKYTYIFTTEQIYKIETRLIPKDNIIYDSGINNLLHVFMKEEIDIYHILDASVRIYPQRFFDNSLFRILLVKDAFIIMAEKKISVPKGTHIKYRFEEGYVHINFIDNETNEIIMILPVGDLLGNNDFHYEEEYSFEGTFYLINPKTVLHGSF